MQWCNFIVVQLRSGAVVQFTCSRGAVVQLRSGAVVQFTCSSGAVVQLRSGAVVQFTCSSGAVVQYLSGAEKLHHYEDKVLSYCVNQSQSLQCN